MSAILWETADNEKEQTQPFFNYLKGGTVEITTTYPVGIAESTANNLKAGTETRYCLRLKPP